MKIKCVPDDFRVIEHSGVAPQGGRFALYRLYKTGQGTLESVDAICRRWNLSRADVHFGGLKDRHAVTEQYLTIRGGPRRPMQQACLQLEYLGQVAEAFDAKQIEANEFVIRIRDLTDEEAEAAATRVHQLELTGMPNYFDRQRFGSVGKSGDFIAAAACRGDYEQAVMLALAEPGSNDRSGERRQKVLMQQHWNDWSRLLELLPRSPRRSTVAYLVDHPTDFRGAWGRIRRDLRSLYLSAFQSFLWNRILSRQLEQSLPAEALVRQDAGLETLLFWHGIPDGVGTLQRQLMPLPSARFHWNEEQSRDLQPLYDAVLSELGWQLREIRVKYPRDSFFSKGERAAVVRPRGTSLKVLDDELHPGRRMAELQFILPRGSYATIAIKHCFGEQVAVLNLDEGE